MQIGVIAESPELSLYPDGRFSHEHPYCFDLEPVTFPKDSIKGDPYKTALTIASELIRGTDSSIEYLQMYCEEYARRNKSER